MNPVPTASTWWQLVLVLGTGTAAVVLAAALLGRLRQSARWERSVWVLCTLSLAALLLAELTGLPSAVLAWCGVHGSLSRPDAPSEGQGLASPSTHSTGESRGHEADAARSQDVPISSGSGRLDSPGAGRSALPAKDKGSTNPQGGPRGRLSPGTEAWREGGSSRSEESPSSNSTVGAVGQPAETGRAVDECGAGQTGERRRASQDDARHSDGPPTRPSPPLADEGALWWPGLVWLLGAVLLAGRALLGQVLALCWRGLPVRDEALCQRVRLLAERLGVRRVRLVVGRQLSGPIALGVLRPTIGLSEGFTAELDDAEQEAVLAHELGHLAAHDPAWHLLADLVTAVLWWHPLAWWARRRFQFASEAAADETCLLLANGPLVLAGCLVALAGRRVRSQTAGLAIDGQPFRSSLGRRVERLLRLSALPWEPSGRMRSALLQTLGPAVLVGFVILSTSWFRPGLQARGDTPMNALHSSWKRSLAAWVVLVALGPDDRPVPAAVPPDKGRAAAPKEQRTAPTKAVADAEVEGAVRLANEQLRRDFPEAPVLAAGDLQSAAKHAEGRTEIVLERRRVAPDRNPFSFVYARIERPSLGEARVTVKAHLVAANAEPLSKPKAPKRLVNLVPPPIANDRSVKYDYDIVYVRVPRKGDETQTRFAEAGNPLSMEPGADLLLLHPDGSEEVLVKGGRGAVADPFVSFDGDWVYYSLFQDTQARGILVPSTADIYKIHVKTRKVIQLTHAWKEFTPNTGAAEWSPDYRTPAPGKTTMPYPVCNTGPCPLPGGKVIFTSNRNGFVSPRSTNTGYNVPLQLFVMDDDGSNVEMIGHLNVGCALHPVVLMDGRVMFSTLENQGQRDDLAWGLWSIHPDGSNWGPLVSAFRTNATHFQTQLSDGHIVVGHYYAGAGTQGFGTYFTLPAQPPPGSPGFGPAARHDPRNREVGFPFSPAGMENLTRFADHSDQTWVTVPGQKKPPGSPHYGIGKFTQPAGAPDNHLLTTWSPVAGLKQAVDSGIYLIKSGQPIDEPGQMLLIKNDPRYNEQWPRALVPYKRIYGVDEPRSLKPLANDGKLSPHLPEGTAFGLVGASSLYKRETVPEGQVARGSVTAGWAGDNPIHPHLWGESNWIMQGADAGLYANDDVHAVRILVMEPTTARRSGPKADRLFRSHAMERLRILGEIPVRKFSGDKQPMDPDGNPDSSFLAKIPANVAWTFQTLDKKGMVLNMAQTWHQLRPGEVRNDCGGCHSHSQQPTLFKDTAAARPDYVPFDLTRSTPLLTSRANDQSKKKWDARDETGLRYEPGVKNVEFHRDVKPILDRSCVACHTRKWDKPAGNLVLDDDKLISWRHEPNGADLPGTYVLLAVDNQGRHGPKPLSQYGQQASRYVWRFQARRSLLIWRVFGQRLDGFRNDDFPAERVPGDPNTLQWKGQPVPNTPENRRRAALAYTGSVMPPLEAVAGSYVGPDGKKIKVAGLSDEDRRTLVRWIDLGCPIDLDYDPARPGERGYGWMLDDNRPTLTVTYPRAGANAPLTRLLVGMHDYYTGLDLESFSVVADFPLDGLEAGENLAKKFKPLPDSRWELKLARPITDLPRGKLTVAVKDRQGNTSRMERTFSVGKK